MTSQYQAEPDPSDADFERIAGWAPLNPFYTAAYAAARGSDSEQPYVMELRQDSAIAAACTAFRKGRRLLVPSLPELPDGSLFWPHLIETCHDMGAERLVLNSYGSEAARIPDLGPSCRRRRRREYHLDLTCDAPLAGLSSNHKRNLKRAEKMGVAVAPTDAEDACLDHARLIASSMARRVERGESVSTDVRAQGFQRYATADAGQIFQASLDGRLLSSILVLRAARGAYYHSAGTTPDGMKCGASHYLIAGVAERLKSEGMERFNLGGAGEEEVGLARFKTGFGPRAVDLEAGEVRFESGLIGRLRQRLKAIAMPSAQAS